MPLPALSPDPFKVLKQWLVHCCLVVAGCPAFADFANATGVDSLGLDIGWYPYNSTADLAALCRSLSGCVAFMTNGWLKWGVRPAAQWTANVSNITDACFGIYIKTGRYQGASQVLC
jgi:hypothetical protein